MENRKHEEYVKMDFFRTEKYDKDFLKPNMMGQNSMMILEELL